MLGATRFEWVAEDTAPTVIALRGHYVLESDPLSVNLMATMNKQSGTSLFMVGTGLCLVTLIPRDGQRQIWDTGILDLQDWTMRSPHGSDVFPAIQRWKFGVRLADGEPRWQLELGQSS